MINISSKLKTDCNSDQYTYREFIIIKGTNNQIDVKAELYQTAYKDTHFIGTFNINYVKFITENDVSYRNKEFVYYKEVNGTSIKIGSFIVTDIVDNDTNEEVTVTAYDYGLKFAKPYETNLDYESGEVTLFQVLQEACEKCEVELVNTSITNGDFIVDSNQFVNNEQFGDVISAIAFISGNFATINDEDKLKLVFYEETDEIIEDYIDLDDKRDTRPITCLSIGTSQVQGQGAEIKDEELIALYGENWLIINDVPFAYTLEKREQLKTAIFEKVKGFGYSSFTSSYSFKPYIQLGDLIKFRNKSGELVESIILRISSNYDDITLEAPSVTDSSVEYENPKSAYDVAKRAEIIANQAEIKITSITTKTEQIEDNLNNNYYEKTTIDKLVQTSETGITNTFSEAGGNNIFRNTGLWFTTTAQNANFENRIKLRTDFELYSKEEASQFINEIGRIGSYEYTYEGSDYTIGTKTFISSVIPLSSTQNIYLFSPTNWLTYKNRDLTYDGIDYNFFSSEQPGMYHTPPYELYGIDENNKVIMKIQPFYAHYEGGYNELSFKNISLDSAYQNFSEELEKAVKGIIIVFKVTLSTYKFNPDDINNPIKNDINIENYIKKYFPDYYNDPNNEENKDYIQQHINDYIPDHTSEFIKNETKKVDIIYQSIKTVSYGNFEYWEGNASRNSNENASNGNSMLLQNGEFSQEQMVNNGRYCISFKYQKLNPLAQASVIINDIEYPLDSEILTEFYTGKVDNETKVFLTQPLVVNAGYIRITFKCDINNAVEVYDLMCNKGISKSVYSQNENETTTDTVNISKGITITSTNMETIFKANADGVRLYTLSGQIKTRFTEKGMTTKEAIVEDEAQIVGTLWQEVEDQTWLTRM